MQQTNELNALFTLIDDPDEEVFHQVTKRISSYGSAVIPNLENLWENSPSNIIQSRIESLIHQLHFTDLLSDFEEWTKGPSGDLLSGALLVARYQYPDFQQGNIVKDIEKIRRNIWLELNSYLTPLEQANVLSSIIYNYYNLKGIQTTYTNFDDFYINKVLENRKGNGISIGILYQILCDLLEINAHLISIPKHLFVAFYHSDYNPQFPAPIPNSQIHFLVDATNGLWYSVNEVDAYLKRMNIIPQPSFYQPISNKKILQILLEELSKCYENQSDADKKMQELLMIKQMLD